jgi:hypothetical protein
MEPRELGWISSTAMSAFFETSDREFDNKA